MNKSKACRYRSRCNALWQICICFDSPNSCICPPPPPPFSQLVYSILLSHPAVQKPECKLVLHALVPLLHLAPPPPDPPASSFANLFRKPAVELSTCIEQWVQCIVAAVYQKDLPKSCPPTLPPRVSSSRSQSIASSPHIQQLEILAHAAVGLRTGHCGSW